MYPALILKTALLFLLLTGLGFGEIHKAPNGKPFPEHWGEPPRIQTRDLRPLPGDYGRGSGTLARWIQKKMTADKKGGDPAKAVVAGANPVAAKKIQAQIAAKEAEIKRLEAGLTTYLPRTKADLDAKLAPIKKLKAEVAALKAKLPAKDKAGPIGKDKDPEKVKERLKAREAELAKLRDFMSRARFTKPGLAKKKAEVAALEKEIARLKSILAAD